MLSYNGNNAESAPVLYFVERGRLVSGIFWIKTVRHRTDTPVWWAYSRRTQQAGWLWSAYPSRL